MTDSADIFRIPIQHLESCESGFEQLTVIAEMLKPIFWRPVVFDFATCNWMDANMCSPLGALLFHSSMVPNFTSLVHFRPHLAEILSKNGFSVQHGGESAPDHHETTIPYKRYSPQDIRAFSEYFVQYWAGKGLPTMSEGLTKKIRESVIEIFHNATTHSLSRFDIFTCGQFFPKKNRLNFTITDLGIGIKQSLLRNLGRDVPDDEAIEWALLEGSTTRTGPIPGGCGLKILRAFIRLNKGALHILSGKGYWELCSGTEKKRLLPNAFPGTVVNIQVNTADFNSYRLSSELSSEDIF